MERNFNNLPYPQNVNRFFDELLYGIYDYQSDSLDDFFSNCNNVFRGFNGLVRCRVDNPVIITLDSISCVNVSGAGFDYRTFPGKIQRYNSEDQYDILIAQNLIPGKIFYKTPDFEVLARSVRFDQIRNKIPILTEYNLNYYPNKKIEKMMSNLLMSCH